MRQIRVVVADDDPVAREVLAASIAAEEGLVLAGAAADADEAGELAARERADVVVIAERHHHEVASRAPEATLVALEGYGDHAGSGVRKGDEPPDIERAIRAAVAEPG